MVVFVAAKKATKSALFCAAASVSAAAALSSNSASGSASTVSLSAGTLETPPSLSSHNTVANRLVSLPRGGGTKDESRNANKKKKTSPRRRRSPSQKNEAEKEVKEESVDEDKSAHQDELLDEDIKMKKKKKPQPVKKSPAVQEILNEDDYYKILGLNREEVAAKQQQGRQSSSSSGIISSMISKAYRRRCVQTHPDKVGGDRRAFDKVAEAYNVLSDDQKRHVYDRLGKRGLEGHLHASGQEAAFSGAGDANELFRRFFGATHADAFASARQQQRRRNRTVRYQLEVTLEDLYQGMTRTVLVEAPPESPWGATARSSRSSPSSKRMDVHIPRGALDGQSIVMSGAMDFASDETPGDIVFLVHQRSHPTFVRKGYDLAINVQIRLREAICGMTTTIQHLDGRKITIGSARQDSTKVPVLIQSGEVQVLKGEGMPKDEIGASFGDLYIVYEVVMPKADQGRKKDGDTEWSSEDREELGRLLDKLEGFSTRTTSGQEESANSKDESAEVVYLEKAALADFGRASGQPRRDSSQDHGPADEGQQEFFGGNQFFFSSSSGASPFFGMNRHGFFGSNGEEEDNAQQCRQM